MKFRKFREFPFKVHVENNAKIEKEGIKRGQRNIIIEIIKVNRRLT